jgi:hypothetical protein
MDVLTATAFVTASVAVLVFLITWGQWVTNRARLRHELFDRRYAMYEQIAAFISEILTSGRVPQGEPESFSRRTKTAYFVFACDNEVKSLIGEIYNKAVELHTLEATFECLGGEERMKNAQEQRAVKDWYKRILNSLETKFEKYLKLTH